jgi:G:T-mismatch repair DNA endonuclease (very short patch repair protein)
MRRQGGTNETLRRSGKLGWKVAIVWECSIKEKGAEAVAGK